MKRKEHRKERAVGTSFDTGHRVAGTLIHLLLLALVLHLISRHALGFDEAPTVRSTSSPGELWLFLPLGYLFTVAIEAPVLMLGLPRIFTLRERLFAGLWLTACTYPVVVLVLPILLAAQSRSLYLLIAETFAPLTECLLFWIIFRGKLQSSSSRKLHAFAVITLANLLSFAGGEVLNYTRWFGLF